MPLQRHSVSLCERDTPLAALTFDDVSVVRGGKLIWSEGTFEVPTGGIVAIIGSNGSGKTSLLNVVLGLIPPASGRVQVLGKSPGSLRRMPMRSSAERTRWTR